MTAGLSSDATATSVVGCHGSEMDVDISAPSSLHFPFILGRLVKALISQGKKGNSCLFRCLV